MPTYDALGVDTLQVQLRWNRVASERPDDPRDPEDPAYEWPDQLDRAMSEARRRGIAASGTCPRPPGGRRPPPDRAPGGRGARR